MFGLSETEDGCAQLVRILGHLRTDAHSPLWLHRTFNMAGSVSSTDIVPSMNDDLSAVRAAVNDLNRALDDLTSALDQADENYRHPEPAPALLTVKDTAARLGVGRTTLYRMFDAGQLAPVPCGLVHRVRSTDVDRLLGRVA